MKASKVKLNKVALSALLLVLPTFLVTNLSILGTTSPVLAQSRADKKAQADRLLQQGGQYYQTRQFTEALQFWQQALLLYREIQDYQGEGNALGNIGVAYFALGDYFKAIDYQQQRLASARQIKDRQGESAALANLGNAYYSVGNYPKAIESFQQRLIIARELKDRLAESQALGGLGVAYDSLGNYPKAIEYHQKSLALAREMKDLQGESNALGNLGIVYSIMGDNSKAIEYQKQSLALARAMKDRQGEGAALGSLGVAYRSLGDISKAIEYSQQSLAIARELKNRQSEGRMLGNLGTSYRYLGDYPKAMVYHQQSLAIARETKNRVDEGNAIGGLAFAYYFLGDYPRAIDYHQQWLSIAREAKDRLGEATALRNIGINYHTLGDYPKAIEYQQQSLAIAREIKNRPGESQSLGNLGLSYRYLGEYRKSIDYHQQQLTIAREIKDRSGESQALGSLALVYYTLGKYPQAIDYYKQSLAIAREVKDSWGEGGALNNLGIAYYKQGNLASSESTLIAAIKVRESLRSRELKDSEKISIFETQLGTYNILQQVLIAQNKISDALEISERGRGRAFVELIADSLSNKSNTQPPAPPTITEIKQIAKQQNTTLVQYSIIYDEFKTQGKQQWRESQLYIWVVKPTGEITFRKADLKPLWQKENITLHDLVTTTRTSIGARSTDARGIAVSYNRDTANAKNRLKRLHELLINPIADLLPKNPNDRVTFIPQSSLFLVPFPALQDKDGKYKIEKHTILTSPSIQVLDLTRKQKQRIGNQPIQANNALIVGNPTMPFVANKIGETPQQLSPLKGSEEEAKAISKLFQTQSLIGNQATETEVTKRLSQARLIHLATHGIFDDVQGLNSSIALAPGNTKSENSNGLLTAKEILDLKLNAELVVLSACDTGRGRISGDGVIGLSRSFISAGVPSVLVSLWAVPDAPTAELMTAFYQNLLQNPDKASALRQAMLTTMKQHSNVDAWAAFTLIGEAE